MKRHIATFLLVAGLAAGLAAYNSHFVANRSAADQKKHQEQAEAAKKLEEAHKSNAEGPAGALDPNKPVGDGLPDEAPAIFKVNMATTKGDVVIEVHKDWAPLGAQRFYELVRRGYFTDIRIFRMVPGFVAQFGISGTPAVSQAWQDRAIKDDPVKESNTKGMVTFAMGGPNSRTTQIFIGLGDNSRLDSMGFAPFGKVIQGMEVAEGWNGEYSERPTKMQDKMHMQGNAFLDKAFPGLDTIKTATIVE